MLVPITGAAATSILAVMEPHDQGSDGDWVLSLGDGSGALKVTESSTISHEKGLDLAPQR